MSNNKKFGLIFLVLVVFPIAFFLLGNSFIGLDSQTNNQLNNILLSVAVIGCTIILFKNKKLENSKKWNIVSTILIILLLLIMYIGNSVSHIGF